MSGTTAPILGVFLGPSMVTAGRRDRLVRAVARLRTERDRAAGIAYEHKEARAELNDVLTTYRQDLEDARGLQAAVAWVLGEWADIRTHCANREAGRRCLVCSLHDVLEASGDAI